MHRSFQLMVVSLFAVLLAGCAATTRPATNVTAGSATLNAAGRTNSTPAHYFFQYATAPQALGTGFGFQTSTRGPIPANVSGPNGGLLPISEQLSGLTPNTTYYYRICGGDGQVNPDVCAQTESFTTPDGTVFVKPGSYTWSVPSGVTSVQIDLYGAQGGPSGTGAGYGGDSPGLGAHVHAVLSVAPGNTYTIDVGGQGSIGDHNSGSGGAGGLNGGGVGGASAPTDGSAGGGGGASDVRSTTPLLVAGGGGGTNGGSSSCGQGGAGGATGQPGGDGCASGTAPAGGGGGGTSTAGGSGGGGAAPGSSGTGGFGGSNTGFGGIGGGGGGGGYFGGGGGGAGFFFPPPANEGTGGGGGGGGSSFVTATATCSLPTQAGAQSGNGEVIITYNPSNACSAGTDRATPR